MPTTPTTPTTPSSNPSTDPAASRPAANSPAAQQPAAVDGTPPSALPPSAARPSAPSSGTSHQASTPVLADAPIQRRATATPRAGEPDTRDDVLDSDEPSPASTSPPASSPASSPASPPTVSPNRAAPTAPAVPAAPAAPSADSPPSEQSPHSVQSQTDQPIPASSPSPTTITVPADIRAAVAATTGVSPATASVVRGEAVSKRARDLQADAFTHRGQVHLPGTAPLTSDRQRRLLAHELTHVVQQENGKRLPPEHTPEGQRLEQKALDVERMLATASSSGAPAPTVPEGAPPTPSSPPVMTPPLTSPAAATPAATPTATSATAPPAGRSPSAGVPAGGSPTKRAPTPGKRVDASSSSDLVRVVAVPRSPRPANRQQPYSSPAASPTPIGQSTPSQDGVAHAAGVQPVALPVVTSHNPAAASSSPTAPLAPDASVVQRRRAQAAPSSTPVPSTTPPTLTSAATPTGTTSGQPPDSRRPPIEREDALPDDAWLERHAAALYPIIRRHLRNELLRDRERRGRLVRED